MDEELHQKVKKKISHDDWLALVTWIDHKANFHGTLLDKTNYQKDKTAQRVPYHLPDPWIPADLNPSFYNKKDSSINPK